jgi:hypothetical protein
MSPLLNPIERIERRTEALNNYMHHRNRTVFGRYPLVFSLLATFGAVSILYGFDEILDQIEFVHAHPSAPILFGIILLALTGSLYKRLEKRVD